MTNDERKVIVEQLLAEGRTLSQIQDYLQKDKGDTITYFDLRMLLTEMPNAKLPEKEIPKPDIVPDDPKPNLVGDNANSASASSDSKLSISVDQTPQPGSMLSGYVRFNSGAKGHWFVDNLGRLGVEPELGSSKPDKKDMAEFSTKLKSMLQQV